MDFFMVGNKWNIKTFPNTLFLCVPIYYYEYINASWCIVGNDTPFIISTYGLAERPLIEQKLFQF
jgi:hypothetical protein